MKSGVQFVNAGSPLVTAYTLHRGIGSSSVCSASVSEEE